MCPCGLEKDLIHGYAICTKHCDAIACKGATGGCYQCATYNARVHNRTTAEHAREKQNNG
jgi:hypothetical protein